MNDALTHYQRELPDAPGSSEEMLSAAFSSWATRGRGWTLHDFPVELEPPFCSLYYLLDAPAAPPALDDGRQATFWSRLADNLTGKPAPDRSPGLTLYRKQLADYQAAVREAREPLPCRYRDAQFVELQLVLPKDSKASKAIAEHLLLSFSYLSCPASFEVIGTSAEIVVQFACSESDAAQVGQQIKAHLPRCFVRKTSEFLTDAWFGGDSESLIVDFGLSNEFFLPLKTSSYLDADAFVSIVGALSDLRDGEVGIFQVLFQRAQNDWAQDAIEAVRYLEETGMYAKTSGAMSSVKEKVKTPLFAAAVRVAAKSGSEQGNWRVVKSLGAGLTLFSDPVGNELIPLANDEYEEEYREHALLNRQSFREGMLLNLEELAGLVHPPTGAVESDKLQRETEQTKAAPGLALHHDFVLGENYHTGEMREVSLSNEQRAKHIHLIGASGGGKSNLLLNLIKQDLESEQGLCVIDPHGDLIDEVIANVPESRIKDVILFDPADADFPIGFNILQANSELEKTLLSSDLVATFRRMSTSWGDVMDSVLANAILAFVESSRGGTLYDLKRFLVEKEFRNEFLKTVNDEAIRYFWLNEFPLIAGKPQSSILIRLDTFLRHKLLRHIVCQKENKIDFRRIMDERKILLVKLSQGAIGEENSYLLGTLLMSKLYQAALSRQNTQHRPFFGCYVDEFHHFITPSMESVLSGIRKYNLGLVLAHQEFRQLQSRNAEVASSVLSNCYTRICFRLGDTDTEKFASGFSFFGANNLQNLGVGEAVGRIERAEFDFNLKIPRLPKVEREIAERRRTDVIAQTRKRYATARAEIEAELHIARTVQSQTQSPEVKTKSADPEMPILRRPNPPEKPKSDGSGQPIREKGKSEEKAVSTPTTSLPLPPLLAASGKDMQGHRYLQFLVKRMAENKGFLVTVEKEVFGGAGKIDVALENGSRKIACEISVTNTADYELQNVRKCLSAGYSPVVVISADGRHLDKIKRLATEHLAAADLAKAHFLTPEEFHSWLENLATGNSKSEEKVKGFKVNVRLKPVDETGLSTRKRAISDVVFGGLKKLKNKLGDK